MTARAIDDVALVGPPRSVTGLIAYDVPKSMIVPISISAGRESTVYRAVLKRTGQGLSQIRLRLPEDTPPGPYMGEATIDGKPRRVAIEVESMLRIRTHPRETKVVATPTSSVEFGLTVMNNGNVSFDVPKSDTFDFDDATGQERALGKALRATLPKGERGIDRFFDELRDSHGGEGRVAVRSGAGKLAPGESRELKVLLDVPATAKEGRSYTGPWTLGNTAHVIVAEITAKPTTPPALKPPATKVVVQPVTKTKAAVQPTAKTKAAVQPVAKTKAAVRPVAKTKAAVRPVAKSKAQPATRGKKR